MVLRVALQKMFSQDSGAQLPNDWCLKFGVHVDGDASAVTVTVYEREGFAHVESQNARCGIRTRYVESQNALCEISECAMRNQFRTS